MKKLLALLSIFSCLLSIDAQEKRTFIKGKILLDNFAVLDSVSNYDIHVINKNTSIGTITNDDGSFEIPIKLGDELYFSHINLQHKTIKITDKILADKNFTINLKEKTETLNEIVLEKQRSIFYKDPDIIEYQGPKVTEKTLHLPFANTVAKEDKAIFKFQSGGIVSLDNLLNSLNGTKKLQKQLLKISKEDKELLKIRKYFTDDFFITDLEIKKEYINQFLNNCVDKNIISIFKSDKKLQLIKLLIDESKLYPHKKREEELHLTEH